MQKYEYLGAIAPTANALGAIETYGSLGYRLHTFLPHDASLQFSVYIMERPVEDEAAPLETPDKGAIRTRG